MSEIQSGGPEQEKAIWQEKQEELKGTIKGLFGQLLNAKGDDAHELFYEMGLDYVKMAREKGVSDERLRQYMAFHILIGSTPSFERMPFLDLEGDLSVVKYIETRVREIIEKPEEQPSN